MSGYALGDSDLNEIYGFPPVTPEQSRLNQILSQGILVTSDTSIDTPVVPNPSQENPDEAILRAALIRELSPGTFVTERVVTFTDHVNSYTTKCQCGFFLTAAIKRRRCESPECYWDILRWQTKLRRSRK